MSEQLLREALIEVRDWIKNWDPNFIYDDEWPATAAKIEAALAASAGEGAAGRGAGPAEAGQARSDQGP
jgi:hypothetical protein